MQVTSGEDEVLAHLREHVEEPGRITAETVRWSGEDLASFAHRLETIRSSDSWGYGLDNANGRIEVDVPGDVGAAQDLRGNPPVRLQSQGNVPFMRPD